MSLTGRYINELEDQRNDTYQYNQDMSMQEELDSYYLGDEL